ncbi:MAG: hypothetical protein WDN28_19765 [Chthoniobacter sp.]
MPDHDQPEDHLEGDLSGFVTEKALGDDGPGPAAQEWSQSAVDTLRMASIAGLHLHDVVGGRFRADRRG